MADSGVPFLHIETGQRFVSKRNTPGYSLHQGGDEEDSGDSPKDAPGGAGGAVRHGDFPKDTNVREVREKIVFDTPFMKHHQADDGRADAGAAAAGGGEVPPRVVCFLSAQDVITGGGHRVSVSAQNITSRGFELTFHVWGDCESWGLCGTFVAFDAHAPAVAGGTLFLGCDAAADEDEDEDEDDSFALSHGNGNRTVSKRIDLSQKLASGRKVEVFAAFSRLNVGNDADHRITTQVSQSDSGGFTMTVGTWNDTQVYDCGVTWIAFDPEYSRGLAGVPQLQTGRVSFQQSKAGYNLLRGDGARTTKATVLFEPEVPKKTHKPPQVCTALCQLDVLADADHRIHVVPEGVHHDLFNLSAKTWSDSQIWSVSAAWLLIVEPTHPKVAAAADATPASASAAEVPRKRPLEADAAPEAQAPQQKRARVDDSDTESDDGKQDSSKRVQKPPAPVAVAPVAAAAAPAPAPAPAVAAAAAAPAAEDEDLTHECKICFDAKINTAIVPCGHMCVCFECSKLITADKKKARCPVCKQKISTILKIFEA